MTRPNFTADENFLTSYVKSSHGRPANSYTWGYLISSSFVLGFGVYQASIPVNDHCIRCSGRIPLVPRMVRIEVDTSMALHRGKVRIGT